MANGRCRMHGGMTPNGPASPHWKTGRYSKYLPTRLLERTQALLADPDVLSLEPNIRLVDAQIIEHLEALEGTDLITTVDRARTAKAKYDDAKKAGNADAQEVALANLLAAIDAGANGRDAMRTIGQLSEQRRRLVETEVKRHAAAANVISLDRAYGLMAAIADVIFRHVTDRAIQARLAQELQRLLNQPDRADGRAAVEVPPL